MFKLIPIKLKGLPMQNNNSVDFEALNSVICRFNNKHSCTCGMGVKEGQECPSCGDYCHTDISFEGDKVVTLIKATTEYNNGYRPSYSVRSV